MVASREETWEVLKSVNKGRATRSDPDFLLAVMNIELVVILYVKVLFLCRKGSRKKQGKTGEWVYLGCLIKYTCRLFLLVSKLCIVLKMIIVVIVVVDDDDDDDEDDDEDENNDDDLGLSIY